MATRGPHIAFARPPEVAAGEILDHMSDPRVSRHMPLLEGPWDHAAVAAFVAAKEEGWRRDGLGHWAILCAGRYAGWGGFQREGDEWDYGLVLKPAYFGLGMRISTKAIEFARADDRIPFVTLLLPPRFSSPGSTRPGPHRERGCASPAGIKRLTCGFAHSALRAH